jgi:hypothetical protein
MQRATTPRTPPRSGLYLQVMDNRDDGPPTLPMPRGGGLSMTLNGPGHAIRVYHWTPEQWAACPAADRPPGATPCACCPGGGKAHHEVVSRPG